ncbi:transposase [Amycolatopsis pigmentata]|uniref:Transposase n=1 Tax=Amycolatopsis pigmentata TaxID=450801 RepID=A0ABW5FJE1_9PSEU
MCSDVRPTAGGVVARRVIFDNLSAHKGEKIRRWARKHRVELCFTPAYASWAGPQASSLSGSSRVVTSTPIQRAASAPSIARWSTERTSAS